MTTNSELWGSPSQSSTPAPPSSNKYLNPWLGLDKGIQLALLQFSGAYVAFFQQQASSPHDKPYFIPALSSAQSILLWAE